MIRFADAVSVGQVKETKEGYLVATARVARTGVQYYLARELGDVALKAGFKPNDIVRVNRPESEVFSDQSLKSLTRVPVTVDHPIEDVTPENWSKYAAGDVGDAYARDGQWVVVNPMIKDARGIQAAQTTHKEISMGYTANLVDAADKSIADFDMANIVYNHLALVPKGRAGPQARIGDSWGAAPVNDFQPGALPSTAKKGGHMTDQFKTVVLGDKAVQVAVTDVAAIEQFKADSAKALADAESKHAAEISAKDEEIGKLKAELADAKKAAEIDVDALVAARTELVAQVKAIDANIDPKGLSDADLRKAAVAARLGDEMVKDASDAEITGMFKAISKDVKNPVADAIRSGIKPNDSFTAVNDAQSAYVARLTRQNKEA